MIEKELDNLLRDKLSGYEEAAPDIWEGISSGLASRRRWRVVRRVSYGAVAAAACLLAGLFLFNDSAEAPVVETLVAEAPVAPESPAPIAQQIKKFTGVVAKAEPVVRPSEALAVAEEVVAEAEAEAVAEEAQPEQPAPQQPSKPATQEYYSSDDFWFEDDETPSKTHTSQISINTNFSAASSNGSFVSSGPSFAGGTDGSTAVSIEIVEQPHYYMPLSFGLQYKFHLGGDFFMSAGVNYTYLATRFDALIDKMYYTNVYHHQHYIGIPVTFSYTFTNSDKWGFYVNAGGTAEKGLFQKYVYDDNVLSDKIEGFQFSAMAGVGIEYWMTPTWGIYLDPSLAYYFYGAKQPLSIRTQQHLQFRTELGFRFRL